MREASNESIKYTRYIFTGISRVYKVNWRWIKARGIENGGARNKYKDKLFP